MSSELIDRRGLFHWGVRGLGATALVGLLHRDGVLGASPSIRTGSPLPHFTPRARRAVHISLVGGMSHIDSFDYKPGLERNHGKPLGSKENPDIFFGQVGLLRKADWKFERRGKSGIMVSEMWPHIAGIADDITVIRSMVSNSANHTPALFIENSGFEFNGFPHMGSWVAHGLGSLSDSLPTFVVLPDSRGDPNGGSSNWTSGFLPSLSQGVRFRSGKNPVSDLFPPESVSRDVDAATRSFLGRLDRRHAALRPEDLIFRSRLRSYELAARMQLSLPEVSDLSGEPESTRQLYGMDDGVTRDTGRSCLLARRLLEKGVRYVQIYSGGPIGGSPRTSWDAHENVKQNHSVEARRIDKPVAGLVKDLKRRGMLEDTLVLFTTEFGRTPFAQSASDKVGTGRDHNRYAFSVWMAGGGLKPGVAYGESDDIGWKVAENPVAWHDFHATVLHLFGIGHERLTFYHNGIDRRLTNVHGHVIQGIIS